MFEPADSACIFIHITIIEIAGRINKKMLRNSYDEYVYGMNIGRLTNTEQEDR